MISAEKFYSYLGELIVEERDVRADAFPSCAVKVNKLTPGGIFIAFDDEENDGLEHLDEAVAVPASVIATTMDYDELPQAVRDNSIGYMKIIRPTLFAAKAAELFAGFPAGQLKLYSVTGTNGKTTSVSLLYQILKHHYGKAGLISTVGCENGCETLQTGYTTPPPFVTQEVLAQMVNHGIPAAALENSSHGLDQFRTSSAKFQAAIFTNLSGDHLDYHKTMENYFAAKARMFSELIAPDGVGVVNIDDPWGEKLFKLTIEHGHRCATVGQKEDATWKIENMQLSGSGTEYDLSNKQFGRIKIKTPLCGAHNVYNTAEVAVAAIETGIPWEEVVKVLANNIQVPGRLERLSNGKIDCFVDYAHTDDALCRVLSAVKPWCKGKLIVVFGAGGDRDRTKRPRMGKVAADIADIAVITSDNPRTEPPQQIIDDICSGIPDGTACRCIVEPDRHNAIKMAIKELAGEGDVVVLAGKGHETYQEINGVRTHFDDREEAAKWL